MAQYSIITRGECVREEFSAGGTITPGMVLLLTSTAGQVVAHNSSGGNCYPLIALEDDTQGNDLDNNYSSGDQVQAAWLPAGSEFYGLIADGENVAVGDYLMISGTAGKLAKYVAQVDSAADVETIIPKKIIGVALEAVDMSGSAGADPSGRCKVKVLG